MKIQTVLYIFFFSCFEVNAQQHFSLNKCIDYAYKQNLEVKLEEISLKKSKNDLKQSEKAIYLNLSGSFSQGINSGRSVDFE
jgi:outer membrane protein